MVSRTIDIHPHVISRDDTRYPRSPLFGVQSDWSRERPVTIDDMIASMNEAGVDKSAIVQASTCYGHDNSYLADSIAKHLDRLTGVCSVDIRAPDAVEKLKLWRERGMTGVRLFTGGSTQAIDASWIDEPSTFPAWDYAAETGMSVCLQMSAAGFPKALGILKQFPKVKLLLDHLARPDLTDGPPYAAAQPLFALAPYGNIYLKVTPRSFTQVYEGKATPESFFKKLVGEFGASRIAWGSNYPASPGPLAKLLATAREALAAVPAKDQEWIFARTAQSIYPALADK
jgi:predicted TIM-barrel fold metal-dependent hydrolase